MWEPPRLAPLWAFTACYRDSFTFNIKWNYVLPREFISGVLLILRIKFVALNIIY
jgi:hypothetical protein